MMEWISVMDRLPEDYGVCLVYGRLKVCTGKTIYQAQYIKKAQHSWKTIVFESQPLDITHWMPLPEPPTDEKDKKLTTKRLKDKYGITPEEANMI